MDPRQRQYQQARSSQTQQSRDNRFSWQIPVNNGGDYAQRTDPAQDGSVPLDVAQLTPQQIIAERVRQQDAQRAREEAQQRQTEPALQQSLVSTPIERRAPAPWGAQRRPSEPTIPQSPTSPEDPPDAPTTLMAPHSFAQPLQPRQPTSPVVSNSLPPASYAVLPQHPTAPLPAQSPPLSVNTDPTSPSEDKPKAMMSSDYPQLHATPNTAASYVPYAEGIHSPNGMLESAAPYSPGLPSKSSPYAPDDLVHVHQQAALQQGRTATFAHDAPVDLRKHQPGQIAHPNQNLRSGTGEKDDWSHGLFACAPDTDSCCLGLWCPCILHSRTTYRLDRRSSGKDPTDMLGFKSCNGSCTLVALLSCIGCLFPMVARTRIRHAYKIEGGVGGDCITSFCCCCCVVVQNEREVKEREENKRRYAGPGGGEGYVPPSAEMRYQPGGA